ncbi:MAG TPA: aspartate dehydrogenase domain-containing protein [Steroidobacteraceae bacterium]
MTALADAQLRRQLLEAARIAGTRLYLPHGAVVGMESLLETRSVWREVRITFRKPATSIDGAGPAEADEQLLFEGSVREITSRFPRSVNAMVACALATVGLDATRARMYADRRLGEVLRGEFEFIGSNGARLTIIKEPPDQLGHQP